MTPSDVAISEFKKIYQEEYGVGISDEEAAEKSLSLLLVFKTLTKPHAKLDRETTKEQDEDKKDGKSTFSKFLTKDKEILPHLCPKK